MQHTLACSSVAACLLAGLLAHPNDAGSRRAFARSSSVCCCLLLHRWRRTSAAGSCALCGQTCCYFHPSAAQCAGAKAAPALPLAHATPPAAPQRGHRQGCCCSRAEQLRCLRKPPETRSSGRCRGGCTHCCWRPQRCGDCPLAARVCCVPAWRSFWQLSTSLCSASLAAKPSPRAGWTATAAARPPCCRCFRSDVPP